MAYDAVHSQSILFGGLGGGTQGPTSRNDTWSWNGSNWVQSFPAVSPAARYLMRAAYDATHNQMVIFGGVGVAGYLGGYLGF